MAQDLDFASVVKKNHRKWKKNTQGEKGAVCGGSNSDTLQRSQRPWETSPTTYINKLCSPSNRGRERTVKSRKSVYIVDSVPAIRRSCVENNM